MNHKFIVESGNWKASVTLTKEDLELLNEKDSKSAYIEAGTKAIEYLYDIMLVDNNTFNLISVLDDKNKNSIEERGYDIPPIGTGIFTLIYNQFDDDIDKVCIRSSVLFANAGLYKESTELVKLENQQTING